METLDEQAERPFLEAIEFALAVARAFNHRSFGVLEVPVYLLLTRYRDERGQRQHQKTRIHRVEVVTILGNCSILAECGVFGRDNGSVEVEEKHSEVGFRLFAGI